MIGIEGEHAPEGLARGLHLPYGQVQVAGEQMPGGARRHPAEPFLDQPDRLSVAPLVAQPVAAPEEVGGRREAWLHEDAQHSVEKSS